MFGLVDGDVAFGGFGVRAGAAVVGVWVCGAGLEVAFGVAVGAGVSKSEELRGVTAGSTASD